MSELRPRSKSPAGSRGGWGLEAIFGPVLIWELAAAARGPWFYFARIVLAGGFGVFLAFTWTEVGGSGKGTLTHEELAEFGRDVFSWLVLFQLLFVLICAPAATGGAFAQDRKHGLVSHMLMTTLTGREIVFGIFLGRLLPMVLVLACGAPVMAFLLLFGGIDPWVLACSYLMLPGTLALVGSVGLCCSLYCRRVHDALMTAYGIIAVWLLLWPLGVLTGGHGKLAVPFWFLDPNATGIGFWSAWYFGVTVSIALVITAWVIVRLRPVLTRSFDGFSSVSTGWGIRGRLTQCYAAFRRGAQSFWDRFPALGLDRDPVLWREWRRGRFTPVKMLIFLGYLPIAGGFTAAAIWLSGRGGTSEFILLVNGLQSAFGLLVLVVAAAVGFGEERARGSLDLLLVTPLSEASIIRGLWLGRLREVIPWSILPAIHLTGMSVSGWMQNTHADQNAVSLQAVVLGIALFWAFACALSAGCLFLATRFRRQHWVLTQALVAFLTLTFGPFLALAFSLTDWKWSFLSPVLVMAVMSDIAFDGFSFFLGADLFRVSGYLLVGLILATVIFLRLSRFALERARGRMPTPARPAASSTSTSTSSTVSLRETTVSVGNGSSSFVL